MTAEIHDEPTTARTILRELPRWRVVLVLLVVLVNMSVVTWLRGCAIREARRAELLDYHGWKYEERYGYDGLPIPPWQWTRSEWAETFAWR